MGRASVRRYLTGSGTGRRFISAGTVTVVSAFALVAPSAMPGPAAAAPAVAPDAAPDEGAAVAAARRHGKRVEALSERTEFTQVFAEPSGQLTYESAAVPQRVRRSNGSWADIDVELARGKDGLLRPAATLADVRFSAGGSGPLVKLTRDGQDLTMSWPLGVLPAPQVSADSATYAEVLPGTDLVLRATRTGFTHVLVVKNAQAAANPAIRELRFDLGGDVKTERLPDGSLRATAGGKLIALAEAPAMWDSSTAADKPAEPTARSTAGQPDTRSNTVSSHAGPGDAAMTARLGTEIDARGDLVLRPDPALLGTAAKFPVFIDPEWSTGKSRWAYATDNNSNNTDTSVARVGADPDSGKVYRSYFEFPTTAIKYKHVESAYVQMKLDHSYSCDDTWTHMYHAGAITTPRTAWKTTLGGRVAVAASHANEGSGCSDSPQPDMWVNFTGTDVTNLVNSHAGKGGTALTFAFSAKNPEGEYETDKTRWKKFFPANAKLITNVDAKPGKPSGLQINGVACTTGAVTIGTTKPSFSAIMPDADGTTQTVRATWELTDAPVGQAFTVKPGPGTTSVTANTRATSAALTTALTGGRRYAFRVYGTDPAPYSINSPWSDYCFFYVDTTVPQVSVTPVTLPTGPGKPGTFTITSTHTDVTKFKYGWTEAVTSEVAATTVTGVTGKQATVRVTAPKYGIAVLHVQAIDATNNKGYGSHEFTVPRPSPALAQWKLETSPGVDQVAALADNQPALAGDTPVTASGITWADKGRVIGVRNVEFAGTGFLTAPNLINTTKSFSVATWAKLDNLNTHQNLISQDGTNTANFQLMFRVDDRNGDGVADKSWCFGFRASDTASLNYTPACLVNAVTAGRWTHVAGSYDETTKKVGLWIDGALKAEVDAPSAWASGGVLRMGNSKLNTTTYTDWLHGSVADAQVFDRALVANDFSGKLSSEADSGGFDEPGIIAPIQVGSWDFETAVPCYETGAADMCEAPDVGTGWNRRLALNEGTWIGGGYGSVYGLEFDDQHYADDPTDPKYQKWTREYGVAQRNTAAAGSPAQWQNGPVLRTDQSFTVSVWVQPAKLDTTMTAVAQRGTYQSPFYLQTRKSTVNSVAGMRFEVMTVSADATENEAYTHLIAPTLLTAQDTNDWFHLTYVYVASSSTPQRLYVNGDLAATGTGTLWNAGGQLTVGGAWWSGEPTTGGYVDQWYGGIDRLQIYQGYMTSGQVAKLHEEQAVV
ncbi:LamG-like jellyroll fold domain-containing protein [Actinoplanes sp. NPDC049802]|uniref:LamG-like jellyroll fold domain-containing protein n=1 Tax=Actinoplanes sp. NPDC049802 TaxID=3154742 RepID=UPI0033E49245